MDHRSPHGGLKNTWTVIRDPLLRTLAPADPAPEAPWTRHAAATFLRAVQKFWEHGDLFSSAAISFYALFSVLPLVILFLVALQTIVPYDRVEHNLGRLFGLTETDLILQTIRDAYSQQGALGWLGAVTLIFAATGVFTALQLALDKVWEIRGRRVHIRFLVGVLTMALSLLIFVGMLLATVFVFRFIRSSVIGEWLGWPQTPPRGTGNAWTITTWLAQFGIFWTGYRFLPGVRVQWRDALPGALVAAIVWHSIAIALSWYLGTIAEYTSLYHSLAAIVALMVWVYSLSATFLLGAEFVALRTRKLSPPGAPAPPSRVRA
jgi:membrane protein